MNVTGHRVRRVTQADLPAVQALFARDPAYFELVEGGPLRDDEAVQTFAERPPTVPAQHKHVFLVDDVALLDMLEGYPDEHTWFLGLIFLAPTARGRGLGRRLVEATCEYARAGGGRALRLAVAATNPEARRFYDRLGFAFVVHRQRTAYTGTIVELDVLERAL